MGFGHLFITIKAMVTCSRPRPPVSVTMSKPRLLSDACPTCAMLLAVMLVWSSSILHSVDAIAPSINKTTKAVLNKTLHEQLHKELLKMRIAEAIGIGKRPNLSPSNRGNTNTNTNTGAGQLVPSQRASEPTAHFPRPAVRWVYANVSDDGGKWNY